jgi:hypothetical protein
MCSWWEEEKVLVEAREMRDEAGPGVLLYIVE